jgi:hypothetical protein
LEEGTIKPFEIVAVDENRAIEGDLAVAMTSGGASAPVPLPANNRILKHFCSTAEHNIHMSSDIDQANLEWSQAMVEDDKRESKWQRKRVVHLLENTYHKKTWRVHRHTAQTSLDLQLYRAIAKGKPVLVYTQNVRHVKRLLGALMNVGPDDPDVPPMVRAARRALTPDKIMYVTKDEMKTKAALQAMTNLSQVIQQRRPLVLVVSPVAEMGIDVSLPYFHAAFVFSCHGTSVARGLYQLLNRSRENITLTLHVFFQHRRTLKDEEDPEERGGSAWGRGDKERTEAEARIKSQIVGRRADFERTYGALLRFEIVPDGGSSSSSSSSSSANAPADARMARIVLAPTRVSKSLLRFEAERSLNYSGNHMRQEFLERVVTGGPLSRVYQVTESLQESTVGAWLKATLQALRAAERAAEKKILCDAPVVQGDALQILLEKESNNKALSPAEEASLAKSKVVRDIECWMVSSKGLEVDPVTGETRLKNEFIVGLVSNGGRVLRQLRNLQLILRHPRLHDPAQEIVDNNQGHGKGARLSARRVGGQAHARPAANAGCVVDIRL